MERWLADEPVTAYHGISRPSEPAAGCGSIARGPWRAAAALLAITGVSIVAAVLVNQARVRETIARRDAETSFQLARKAVDDFFTQVSETTLLNVPGLQPLRKDLLQVALVYDQEFLKQRGHDPCAEARGGRRGVPHRHRDGRDRLQAGGALSISRKPARRSRRWSTPSRPISRAADGAGQHGERDRRHRSGYRRAGRGQEALRRSLPDA